MTIRPRATNNALAIALGLSMIVGAEPGARAAEPAPLIAEPAVDPPHSDEPTLRALASTYHQKRTTLGLAGMGTLTGWAVVNIAGGLAGNLTTTGTIRFFHQGNAAWNTVNLALGIAGLVSQRRERDEPVDLATGRARARRAQVVFGINAGLDVLYVSTGAILWSLGQALDPSPSRLELGPRLHGYGQALVLQGLFLFVFDVAMMVGHERQLVRTQRRMDARLTLRPTLRPGPHGRLAAGLALQFHR
ncbi:MAG: hypothetical protein AAGF11_36335 [Myxococcota bacterium]